LKKAKDNSLSAKTAVQTAVLHYKREYIKVEMKKRSDERFFIKGENY